MTIDDVKTIMNQIALRYPGFVKGKDKDLMLRTWTEDLKHFNLSQAKEALSAYVQKDKRGFPPTAGQLIALMPQDFEPLDASEFFAGTVKCPYCNDTGWIVSLQDVGEYAAEVAHPCENCRTKLHERWEKDFKGKERVAGYWTVQDDTVRFVRG